MVPNIVVIGERPSLAEALIDLFSGEGWRVDAVESLEEAAELAARRGMEPAPLLISASNAHRCETIARWRSGLLRSSPLVVVGNRDPAVRSEDGLYVVALPLVPGDLLRLVQRLAAS